MQYRNKQLVCLQQAQSGKMKASRRHERLQWRKYRLLDRAKRRIRDLCHKATRRVAEAFPGALCYVGEPFNDAAQRARRTQAQTISQTCTRKLIQQLDYKTTGAIAIDAGGGADTPGYIGALIAKPPARAMRWALSISCLLVYTLPCSPLVLYPCHSTSSIYAPGLLSGAIGVVVPADTRQVAQPSSLG
jgi:hypothetical protein